MQWSGAAGAGFTRGTPWEALQAGGAVTNVASEDTDPGSLLALYRRLIRLRLSNSALGSGDLVPLDATQASVAAYLRREGERIVLVVANLSALPVSGVALTSSNGALPPGGYVAKRLLQPGAANVVTIAADGRLRGYVPVPTLAPLESWILELSRTP